MVSSDNQKKDILTIQEILSADNVADLLDANTLTDISKQVFDDFSKDQASCEDRINRLQDIVKLAKMIAENKTYPWDGASNVIYPLVANAAIEFGATLYPEIIKDSTVVKCKVIGKDDGKPAMDAGGPMIDPRTNQPIMANAGAKKKRGERVATYMNYQLLEELDYWESDVDKLGNAIPVLGNLYKKIYWDPIKKEVVSELIFPDRIVINNGARDIKSAIITHKLELYPQEIMTKVRSGIFTNIDWDYEQEKENQEDPTDINSVDDLDETMNYGFNTKLHTFLQQHTWLDLDKDGFPEPYVVTVHSDQSKQVVRIIPRFREQDVEYNSKKEVSHIKAKCYFVKYGFIPSPDGSFFDIAFGDLLYNLNLSVNTTLNQLFDAGHLGTLGGGFIGKMKGLPKGRLALSPGEWKQVDAFGDDISKNIVPIPQPRPDPTLFALLGYLVEAGKNMALLRDVLTGESMGNVAATTQISMVEQGLKQFKAIYKRFYKSVKEELKMIYDINAEELGNDKYAEVLDEPIIDVDVKMDFSKRDYNICPVADIDAVTSYQRMAQAQFLMGFVGNPYVDQKDLLTRIMTIAQVDDIDKLVVLAPPPQNPLLEIEQLKSQVKMQELQLEAQKMQQQNAIDIQLAISNIEKLKADIEKIHTSSMVDLANVAKIGNEIEDAAQEREVKIMDNIIDSQTKQIEVAGRLREAQINHATESLKLHHTAVKANHEQEMMKKELNESTNNKTEPA